MIIGNGLIGNSFRKYDENFKDCIIFASGVSDSNCDDDKEYEREVNLVKETIENNIGFKFIYFSSVLSDISNTKYYKHKKYIEELIKLETLDDYLIFKIPQIIGFGGNKNTLFNYLCNTIKSGGEISTTLNIKRSLIDIDDLINIVKYCIDRESNKTLILSHISYDTVIKLSLYIGYDLGLPVNISLVDKLPYNECLINNSCEINDALNYLGLIYSNDDDAYHKNIIKKYINYENINRIL